MGKGDLVDEKLFMQWQDPDPLAVNIVSISTGWGATGVWEFSGMKGTVHCVSCSALVDRYFC